MFELPPLPFAYNALEPYIDAKTMEIHHSKHHAAYINNLNNALKDFPEFSSKPVEELLTTLNSLPETIKTAVRNNAGGHYNHSFFWNILGANANEALAPTLGSAIVAKFGTLDTFKEQFAKSALGRFGSGWAWLVVDSMGNLLISSTPNQDSPISEGMTPILGLDVWEHAYYLLYQNKRADYINAWWNVVNWTQAENNFTHANQ